MATLGSNRVRSASGTSRAVRLLTVFGVAMAWLMKRSYAGRCPGLTALLGQIIDQPGGQLPRVGAEAAVGTLAQAVRHARADAGIATLGPDGPALASHIGRCGAAIAAHATERNDAAESGKMLGKIEHHLIDRRAVGFWPGSLADLHGTCVAETQLTTDRHHHHLAAAHRIAVTRRIDAPLAMPSNRLWQRRLETGVDMLGIDEAHRQTARQGIEERLDRRRAAERGGQQPDLAG